MNKEGEEEKKIRREGFRGLELEERHLNRAVFEGVMTGKMDAKEVGAAHRASKM